MILSASRRTDIPTFFSDWFLARLKEGFLYVRNPYNRRIGKLVLTPEEVELIVFWTKNAMPLTPHLDEIERLGYTTYCFFYTVTPYGLDVEAGLPEKNKIVENFIALSKKIGRDRMTLRYDPILIDRHYTPDFHVRAFRALLGRLEGYTERVVVSFIDLYPSIKGAFRPVSMRERYFLLTQFEAIAAENGMSLQTCCEQTPEGCGVISRACIDRDYVEKITGLRVLAPEDGGQRTMCRCIESVDIGNYDTCKNGCRYCYATHPQKPTAHYDPSSPILCDSIDRGEIITLRHPRAATTGQLSFFEEAKATGRRDGLL
ncbi:MAG: DUF1848 domain-containing protein [Peptoniphilus sp.]|nr:DUF1848 domain-containing protein [Peptoniphilus sp.]MDD7362567.1 DUF1848 domain-containing protein [Bacillota bacterium]MDY6045034.1 DUF1848 domain-containing protein [Peptoniphilus sp.]